MTYRVLVPLDGSELADRAIPWADEIAGPLQAEVELLRVIPHNVRLEVLEAELQLGRGFGPQVSGAGSDDSGIQILEAEAQEAQGALSRRRSRFRRARSIDARVLRGDAADVIVARAQEWAATLVVMASHGRSGVARALLGSVAGAVIRRSGVPVLVVRSDLLAPARVPQRVLVPLDGSDLASAVLPCVVPLAKQLDSTLVLISVAELPPQSLPVQGASIPLGRMPVHPPAQAMEYLDRVADDLRAQGVACEVRVEHGDPASAITRAADGSGCDLIAMSTHGRHGLGRWALGSVTDSVMRRAQVPVLAVRPLQVPTSSRLKLRLAETSPLDDARPVEVRLTARQIHVTRIALEHLAWSATRHEHALEDIRRALQVLDAVAEDDLPVR